MAFMTAGSTKLLDPLKDPLGGYNRQAQGGLADALGRIQGQGKRSATASGRPQGQYVGESLGRANTMASGGIENTLGGILGGASLQDAQAEQEFQRQMALANEIGDLSSPSTIQEIMAGLGGGAGTALQFKGLYDALGKNGGPPGAPGAVPPNLSLYDPYSSGYSRYR